MADPVTNPESKFPANYLWEIDGPPQAGAAENENTSNRASRPSPGLLSDEGGSSTLPSVPLEATAQTFEEVFQASRLTAFSADLLYKIKEPSIELVKVLSQPDTLSSNGVSNHHWAIDGFKVVISDYMRRLSNIDSPADMRIIGRFVNNELGKLNNPQALQVGQDAIREKVDMRATHTCVIMLHDSSKRDFAIQGMADWVVNGNGIDDNNPSDQDARLEAIKTALAEGHIGDANEVLAAVSKRANEMRAEQRLMADVSEPSQPAPTDVSETSQPTGNFTVTNLETVEKKQAEYEFAWGNYSSLLEGPTRPPSNALQGAWRAANGAAENYLTAAQAYKKYCERSGVGEADARLHVMNAHLAVREIQDMLRISRS